MPITLTPFDYPDHCYGHKWEITDMDALAYIIARVALGQHRHAKKILNAIKITNSPIPSLGTAIDLLTVPEGSDPWHRDGWLFQAMSWIVANKTYKNSLILNPHMIHADKGFDGLHVTITDGKITDITIYEDKATEHPRDTIRDLVWPEFRDFEEGLKDNILLSDITPLLEGQHTIDVDAVIEQIIWSDLRHYRISITIGDTHNSPTYHKSLFNDYNDITQNHIRRKAETFYAQDIRTVMQALADRTITKITEIMETKEIV